VNALREALAGSDAPSIDDVREATRRDLEEMVALGSAEVVRSVPTIRAEIAALTQDPELRRSRVMDCSRHPMGDDEVQLDLLMARLHRWGRVFTITDRPISDVDVATRRAGDVPLRVASLPFRCHTFDRVAFVSWDFDDARSGAYRVEDPQAFGALAELFTAYWRRSNLVFGPAPGNDVLAVLRMLDSGRSDEAAAAALGVSLRTYRRRVAELLEVLGVRTRFAAGRVAAERGLMQLAFDELRAAS
jgi:hypothetical protein